MRKTLSRIIKTIGVSIAKTDGIVACYDPNEHVIEIPRVSANPLYAGVRRLLRPSFPDYSLAHEVGHAVEFRLKLWRKKEFRRLFGNLDMAEGYDPLGWIKCAFSTCPKDYVTPYAASHPAEDFAETFALCITAPAEYWEGESNAVLEKKEYVEKVITQILRRKK